MPERAILTMQRFALAAVVLAAFALPAVAQTVGPGNPKLQQIIAAAKAEGQLSLVMGEGTIGNQNSGLGEAFDKYYGFNLDVRFTPGPPMPNVAAAVVQQAQAKKPAVTDVIIGYANHMMTVINADAVQKPGWKDWAPNLQAPGLVSSEGAAVPVQSSTPGIAYNSNVLQGADIPTRFHDFLKPSLKGRVATTPYASSFDRLATSDMWGKDETMKFARALSDQVGGLIRCNELDRLASGEFDAFGLTCSQNDVLGMAQKGAPVGFVLASDAPIVMYLYEAVPATATHPNAAMLWINFMSSPEAQKALYAASDADLHLIPGSHTAASIRALEAKGAKFLIVNTDFYRHHDQAAMDQTLQDVQKILQKR